jgi:hypothetical protein
MSFDLNCLITINEHITGKRKSLVGEDAAVEGLRV